MSKLNEGMFTSDSEEWETPIAFFKMLDDEFHFTLDVCASDTNHKVKRYFTVADDALSESWDDEVCWMNPPYGKSIGKWIEKAYNESKKGATVVCLIPSRTDTKYWHDYVMKADEIRFIKGRLKFLDAQGNENMTAPFPSAVVVFEANTFYHSSGGTGPCGSMSNLPTVSTLTKPQ